MAIRLKKIHKQLLVIIGLFVFVAVSLQLMPVYLDTQDSVLVVLSTNRFDNTTRAQIKPPVRKLNVWKVIPGDDRILNQLKYKPDVNTTLPPKTIIVEGGSSGWGVNQGNGVFVEQDCPVKHCTIVDFLEPGKLYDARMFKEIDLSGIGLRMQLAATQRHPEQVWIMFGLESPLASPDYMGLNNVINWTATYRPDSTIVAPYEKWMQFDNFTHINNVKPKRNFASGKTKMGAMFVSNCPTQNNRLEYVKKLKEYIHIDVYGACGDLHCDKNSQHTCFNMLNSDYKFYFAFENANCRHYITEKLFLNALRHNVLPIVMGAHPDDYKRAAPPGSYIHVDDFESPKHLAEYLKKLDSDDEEYNKYFRWQSTGEFVNTKFWCRICSMLWSPERPQMSVPDLNEWWRGGNTCIGDQKWKEANRDIE